MNPFPKAPSGSYKLLLVEGLKNLGRTTEAEEFERGTMKLAIANTITGGVRTFPKLNDVCANALGTLEPNDVIRYYFWGLSNGQFVVASSNGAYVYDENDADAVAHAKRMSEASDNELIQPFFNS